VKILIVCLYDREADPIISIAIARAMLSMKHDVCALLEEHVVNREEWNQLLPPSKIEYVNIELPKVKKLRRYAKLVNAAWHSLRSAKDCFPKISSIEFDLIIYTFYHHWNDILIQKLHSRTNILYLHDPIPHSGEAAQRFTLQHNQAKRMDYVVVLSKKFVETVVEQYGINRDRIIVSKLGEMSHSSGKWMPCDFDNTDLSINFLFFGRIAEYKGIHVLLKAYRSVHEKFPNTRLTIAGNGDFSEYVNDVYGSMDVDLINRFIDDDEIESLFTVSNTVVVLPYLDATQSGVIPIAAKYGNPVIASATGGLIEQLDDGKLGLLIEPDDIGALAKAMQKFIEDSYLRQLQSKQMKAYYSSLNWDIIIEKLLSNLNLNSKL